MYYNIFQILMGIGVIHLLIFKMKLILKKVIEFFVTKIIAIYYN